MQRTSTLTCTSAVLRPYSDDKMRRLCECVRVHVAVSKCKSTSLCLCNDLRCVLQGPGISPRHMPPPAISSFGNVNHDVNAQSSHALSIDAGATQPSEAVCHFNAGACASSSHHRGDDYYSTVLYCTLCARLATSTLEVQYCKVAVADFAPR